MKNFRLMHRGICITAEPNMTPEGEIIVGEGAGVHNVETEIVGWDTRKDKVYKKVKNIAKAGMFGRMAIHSKKFIE